jgi:hypothetical protein
MRSSTTSVRLVATVIAIVATSISAITAAKAPADQPVTAEILGNPNSNSAGGMFSDDGGTYPAVFNSNGEFYLDLQSGLRYVNLYFKDWVADGTCDPSCKTSLLGNLSPAMVGSGGSPGYLRTNLVDENDNEVAGGIANMPILTPMKARFLVTFNFCCDPSSISGRNKSGTIGFVLRYWPAYLGAAYVNVTRNDVNHWVIESSDSNGQASDGLWDAARLIRPNGFTPIYEDLWRMPFRITVTRP